MHSQRVHILIETSPRFIAERGGGGQLAHVENIDKAHRLTDVKQPALGRRLPVVKPPFEGDENTHQSLKPRHDYKRRISYYLFIYFGLSGGVRLACSSARLSRTCTAKGTFSRATSFPSCASARNGTSSTFTKSIFDGA